jgi:hypothetical protein
MSDLGVADKLQVGSLKFMRMTYGDLDVEWTNHATDHWHSDSEVNETISREDAQKLFDFLWTYLAP